MIYSLFSLLLFFSLTFSLPSLVQDEYPTSCHDLEDGDYYLQLIDDKNYPIVYQRCSNGYMIIDYNKDPNIAKYFSSWEQWHIQIYGPSNNELINWREWYLPDSNEMLHKYILSPNCDICDSSSNIQLYSHSTTYWMTGTLFGCFWLNKGNHNCDIDYNTYNCYTCKNTVLANEKEIISDEKTITNWDRTGVCPINIRKSYHRITKDHFECTTSDNSTHNMKPSIGVNGKYCICTKPTTLDSFKLSTMKLNLHKIINTPSNLIKPKHTITKSEETINPVNIKLYQTDFKSGTYRIKNPGTYTIMEDIYFDFNSGDINDPQKDGAWWPTEDQNDDYPGAGKYKDPYFLGFFAGITVEVNNVIIDLNGYSIQQSGYFYYQQRWFVNIELTTQYFLPGQGLGNFGPNPKMAQNVVIKNGILGLTSHHGIHGNNNKNIKLQNIKIREFETHGIQLNGFDNVELNNIEIGPVSKKVYFSGEYSHMRGLLPRLRKIAVESDGQTIQFYNRDSPVTMSDIVNEIEDKMNMVWNYVVNGITYDDDNTYWLDAKKLFYNEGGLPNAGAIYGIFLNTYGASVFTYNLFSREYSNNVRLNNIIIHDLEHNMKEYVSFRISGKPDIYINPFTAPLSVEDLFEDTIDLEYKGNIVLDSYFAMEYFSNNWYYLGAQVIGKNRLLKYVLEGDKDAIGLNSDNTIQLSCNTDVMLHSGKGINGLRLDGVKNAYASNIKIYNIKDITGLGKLNCGNYGEITQGSIKTGKSLGHFRATAPMQIGFSGNIVTGIQLNSAINLTLDNVNIYDLESYYGKALGIAIWPSNDITLNDNINIYNLFAGTKLALNTYKYNSAPNSAPESCAILIYTKYYSKLYQEYLYTTVKTNSKDGKNNNIKSWNINGHVGCIGDSSVSSMIGYGSTLNDQNTLAANNIINYNNITNNFKTLDKLNKKNVKKSKSKTNSQNNNLMFAFFSNFLNGKKIFTDGNDRFPDNNLALSLFIILLIVYLTAIYKNMCKKQSNSNPTKLPNPKSDYGSII